ncbi:septum site-determining protein Ssd [Solicola sp. PLA-1-18]|uniref:septum site-determining protein Ssd n=1 Tax=Solicola sp. PLA-1-18 TaxID=3380532 RepID=UPI003B768385
MSPDVPLPVDRRPVVVTADEQVLEELLRLCAAADVVPVVAGDVASARRAWTSAAVVVVDAVEAALLATHSPPRRSEVHLVARRGDGEGAWRSAVALGAEHVHVLPDDERALVDALAASVEPAADDSAVVAVVAGSGGAGASTLAAALAVTASRRGVATLLVDADPLGGGIDLVVGAEESQGLRWPDLAGTQGRLSGESLREALPRTAGLSVLSWDRGDAPAVSAESMRSVLAAGRRAGSLVVVDVARRLDPAAEEALLVAHRTLLVVSADVRGVAAATRTLASVRELTGDVGLVVRGPGPSGLDADLVASTLGAPLVARVRDDRRLAAAVDEGLGPVAHRRSSVAVAAGQVLEVVRPARDVA